MAKLKKMVHRNLLLPLALPVERSELKNKPPAEIEDDVFSETSCSDIEIHMPVVNDSISDVADEEVLSIASSSMDIASVPETDPDSEPELLPAPELRRSTRSRRPPSFLGDYVSHGATIHMLD